MALRIFKVFIRIINRLFPGLGVLDDFLTSQNPRVRFAKAYLSGEGLEIGALHEPLKVPVGCKVRYVDICTKAESVEKFPELDAEKIVEVDLVTDGFCLLGVEDGSVDFIIANHVLEHTPNPIGVLETWFTKVRPGGILFFALPELNNTFDKGRFVTSVEHMVSDYEFYQASPSKQEIESHNLGHYEEWVTISAAAINGKPYSESETDYFVRDLSGLQSEIHFHTFTSNSAKELLNYLSTSGKMPLLEVELVALTEANEILVVCRKSKE